MDLAVRARGSIDRLMVSGIRTLAWLAFARPISPNSTSILPTTILKQSFVDGAQYLLLFLSQGDHTSESKAALGIA